MAPALLHTIEQQTRLAGHNRLALLLFRLGGPQLFGINVFKVQEVVRRPPLRWVPGLHRLVAGVASVRRRTIPVLDLARAIRHPPAEDMPYMVVSEFNRRVQGFLVEAVDRIVHVDVEDVKPPPRIGAGDSFLTAVTRAGEELVQIIDVERVLAEVIGGPGALANDALERLRRQADEPPRVLVADDSAVARSQIRNVLEDLGIDSVMVSDGREALEHLRKLADAGHDVADHYALVISDIEMPDMDGYTLTARIRSDPRLRRLRVLLHTSLSGVFNRSLVERVGADAFVAKYSPEELAEAIVTQLEAGPHPERTDQGDSAAEPVHAAG